MLKKKSGFTVRAHIDRAPIFPGLFNAFAHPFSQDFALYAFFRRFLRFLALFRLFRVARHNTPVAPAHHQTFLLQTSPSLVGPKHIHYLGLSCQLSAHNAPALWLSMFGAACHPL